MESNNVCVKHILDLHLQEFIKTRGAIQYCKYCEKLEHSVSIQELASYIEEEIRNEYAVPYSLTPYLLGQGPYEDMFPDLFVSGTIEILDHEVAVDNFKVVDDLAKGFSSQYWVVRDSIFGASVSEYLLEGWESFQHLIKHKVRFLFFTPSLEREFEDESGIYLNPTYILDEVGKGIVELNLFKTYETGDLKVFRARQHGNTEHFNTAFQLGSPPPEIAKANRMSPAGISMFYGAFDMDTCEKEIINAYLPNTVITTGTFQNLRELTLVDFTKLRSVPSLFDKEYRDKRNVSRFLFDFINDLSTPVAPDERVHIDYVPTQVVTEYLKIVLGKEKQIDGIMYNSVKNPTGICVVLFVENSDSTDSIKMPLEELLDGPIASKALFMASTNKNHTLTLDNTSIISKPVTVC